MSDSGELTPRKLAEALRGGFDYLQLNRGLLDRLNVFPVPDGDTGSNMASTLASGIDTIDSEPPSSFAALADRFLTEINRCSRGNSGFILARFFHGFFEIAVREEALSVPRLAESLSNGAFHVNGALFAPTEGTMISILSAVTDALTKTDHEDMASALDLMDDAGTRALFRTPEQLPVLARAGVIDSGALGLLCIFRGMAGALAGVEPVEEQESDYRFEPNPSAGAGEAESPSYRYCTEAVVSRNGNEDESLSPWLAVMGDSIALVKDDQQIKIHIHTNEPEKIFDRLKILGTLEHTKVDDMAEQTRLVSADAGGSEDCAVLAFVPGEGFERFFEDLGVDHCFIYSDTLPSPQDIASAVDRIPADQVIVLPNNSNILPSVMSAGSLTEKSISIIPTKTVIQGITVSYGYSSDDSAAANVDSMTEFMDDAVGLFVYRSAMETRFGDRELKEGDWFVTRFDQVLGAAANPSDAIREALSTLETDEITEATIYHGDGFDPRELENVMKTFGEAIPDANLEEHFGGQEKAALIISLE